MPVRIRPAPVDAGTIRLSLLTRSLVAFAAPSKHTIQLSELMDEEPTPLVRLRQRPEAAPALRWVAELAAVLLRRAVAWMERGCRVFLIAPMLAVRTTEALIGDDTNRVVRVAPELFPLLGIQPGDHVIVQWGARGTLAIALQMPASEPVRDVPQEVDRDAPLTSPAGPVFDDALVRHLTIGVAAEMRSNLGIPRRTVVTIRRRVVPLIFRRINELTIPVGGLLLAAATIKGVSSRHVVVGLVAIVILAMLPARHKGPPAGRWP
jgi:hypothetical protein